MPMKMIRNAVMRTAKGKLRSDERKIFGTPAMPGHGGATTGVWLALISRSFGFELNLHDFSERHHDFLFYRALDDLHVHFIGGDARDAFDHEQRAPRFHGQHQIFFGFAPDHGEETGKLRLKKAAVERELSALKNLRAAGPAAGASFCQEASTM